MNRIFGSHVISYNVFGLVYGCKPNLASHLGLLLSLSLSQNVEREREDGRRSEFVSHQCGLSLSLSSFLVSAELT